MGRAGERWIGIPGSYLLMTVAFLLSIISTTSLSVSDLYLKTQNFVQWMALYFGRKLGSFLTVWSARSQQWLQEKRAAIIKGYLEWQESRRQPTIVKSPQISTARRVSAKPVKEKVEKIPESSPEVSTSQFVIPPLEEIPDVAFGRLEDMEASITSGAEPKILPRVDLKEIQTARSAKDQLELGSFFAEYKLPQLSFLDSESQSTVKVDEEALKMNSKLLEKKLLDYGVEGRITEIHPGPVITMYEFEPAPGVKVNKIVNLEDDLSLTMGGKSVRIVSPLPGKAAVGIEIPNNERETVWLKDVIGHPKFQKAESKITLAIGKDTEGIPYVSDLAKMPHMLVAGATGAGKSVQINSIILSLLYKATPDEVRLIMVDPKMLELSMYEGIPHLLLPVVTQPKKASMALRWAVGEMERRYELLSHKSTRNILGYNKIVPKEERLPYIVILIDELADLMMTAAKDVEASVTRLAQMARAAGIHLILATQRPSVDVITGLIKANFPARISFKVSSKHDSRTIIDAVGAEHLLGSGDMLFMSGGASTMLRVHGAFVSEVEIERVVTHWKQQGAPKLLDESVLKEPVEEEKKEGGVEDFEDELYDQAIKVVTDTRQASISMIQRRLRIGYNRAARMIERMEQEGIVGPADGARPREVFAQEIERDL
ncbi:MAG: hypothetical protein IPJ69_01550 [Deltaproteobacteria bacterium]|nr:MAG: hypothetical protein IPJ69_01550 [Deltaproteobacteria bacterium]